MKVQIFVFLATLSLVAGHLGGALMLQDVSPQVYCGRNLAIAISELCLMQRHTKRSEGNLLDIVVYYAGTGVPPYYKEDYGWPWLAPHKARGLAPRFRGKRLVNGVVDECCVKPCSMEEMLGYC